LTKQQVFFMDDDPLVLQGLQRMLHSSGLCGIQDRHPRFETGRLDRPAMERVGRSDLLEGWEALAREIVAGKGGA
jgi:hypothetical protein